MIGRPDLSGHIGDIARLLLGEPNKALSTRTQWRYGNHGSIAVEIAGPKRGEWYDHETNRGGGPWEMLYLIGELDKDETEHWLRDKLGIGDSPGRQRVIKSYLYRDERDAVLFKVCRWGPQKRFTQHAPDGSGGWTNGKGAMTDVRRVLYRLPELIAAKAKANGTPCRVYLVEGEKDTDRMVSSWGVTATTCPGGAGKWRKEYNQFFAGADVVIIPDNDEAGHRHAAMVAPEVATTAAQVRVIDLGSLGHKGDISDWIESGGSQTDLETLIELRPAWFDGKDDDSLAPPGQPGVKSAGRDYGPIPPRQWLLGTNFCRGFLSGITGAGSAGKTAVRILQFIALALGRGDLTDEHVFKRTKVLIVCLEDDEAELRRRVRAVCIHHQIEESDLDGWLYYWTPRDLHLLEIDERGRAEPGGLTDALRRIINRLEIGLVSVDPFVKSHGAEENDNSMIDRAASLFLGVAHDCGCAADYVHHHRKGITLVGNADSARGASALVNASRLVKTVTKMSATEAERLGVSADDAKLLVRIDDAKLNIAPPAEETMWFRLVGVDIGNPDQDYPRGDNVQTVERWHPPDAFDDLPKSKIAEILAELRQGPSPGEFYLTHANANGDWAGWPIAKLADKAKGEAKRILHTWINNDVLIESKYESLRRHKTVTRVTVNEAKAVEMLGHLWTPP